MTEAPKVFISYSHDSSAHKQWVRDLAARLVESGVDVQLDQWDLKLGQDVTRFMEEGLTKSSRVLVVCTDNYIRKADVGEGGVGYERIIVTAELVSDQGTGKFIPIVRNVSGSRKTPVFLATRLFIDFSNDADFEFNFEQLLRELHGTPAITKPPLGKNPYAPAESNKKTIEQLSKPKPTTQKPKQSSENFPALPKLSPSIQPEASEADSVKTSIQNRSRTPKHVRRSDRDGVKKPYVYVEKTKSEKIVDFFDRFVYGIRGINTFAGLFGAILIAVVCGGLAGLTAYPVYNFFPETYYLKSISIYILPAMICGFWVIALDSRFMIYLMGGQQIFIYYLLPPALIMVVQSWIIDANQYFYLEKFGFYGYFIFFGLYVFLHAISVKVID